MTRRRGSARSASFEDWDFWWGHNKEAYLHLKERLYSRKSGIESESAAFFLGRRTKEVPRNSTRPTPEYARAHLIPTLLQTLGGKDFGPRESACLALGKVGQSPEVAPLVARLSDKVRDVREHAAIGLGLLRSQAAIPYLLSILEAGAAGRSLRGREPEYRLRAFAAMSLGLTGDNERGEVRDALAKFAADASVNRNIGVNCTLGLGLLKGDAYYVHGVSQHLLELAAPTPRRDTWIRAHALVSLGRLHERNGSVPGRGTIEWVVRLLERDKTAHVRRSAAISLGMLVEDAAAFPEVVGSLKTVCARAKDNQARNFAAVALGQIGGDTAYDTLKMNVARLRGQKCAFNAIALGILCRDVTGNSDWMERRLTGLRLLRNAFEATRVPHLRGAFAIALGIAGDTAAGPMLLDASKRARAPDLRGYLAVALGMVNHGKAVSHLGAMLAESENDPLLHLRVTVGLGLMGAREFIPGAVQSLKATKSVFMLCAKSRALGYIGDSTAIRPLLEFAKDRTARPMTRSTAILALGNIADPEPVPAVSALTNNHNYLVSTECLTELLAIL